ncbi:MAG: hypothetical protein IKS51_00665 [Erysipelotrichaceae bacterium]|nr:hypothetical protein [Erysipelotrichaceae bacterium]
MTELEYLIDCLDGSYRFLANWGDLVSYEIVTDIPSLESISGELNEADSKAFIHAVEDAKIERWQEEYKADASAIEDGIRWSVRLEKEGKKYRSHGEESFVPYGHEELIKAIRFCDVKNDYLF